MKKLLIVTAALALSATAAFAAVPGVDLSWNACNTAAASANKVYACDGQLGAPVAFQGSFILNVTIPDFAATSSVVDIGFAGTVPSYWKTGAGECNQDAITLANPSVTTPCGPNLFGSAVSAGGFVFENPTPSRLRMRIDYAQGAAAPVVVNPNVQYGAFKIQMDPDQGFNNGCAGCLLPACLVLNSVLVQGFTQPAENYFIEAQDVRNFVTWQGGAIGGAGCPAATPTHNSTWGSVKALYR
jgi:hypothetical protein